MFSDKADFSNLSEEKLKVSKVIQKAMIEVNEEGSEAAAVTGQLFFLTTVCVLFICFLYVFCSFCFSAP